MAGDMPRLDPGYCFNAGCGRCSNGSSPLFDTEVDVPYEPAIALCTGCITDLARRAGVLPEERKPAPRKKAAVDA